MTKQTKKFSDLQDSQLLYDKNPPPLSFFLVTTILLALVTVVIWSIYAPKTYVVKSHGSVVSEARNYIMSAYSGEIVEANVTEGSYVEKGEILFQISSTDLDLQAEQLNGLILVNQEKITQYERLEYDIKNGVNSFDEKNDADKIYFYMYEAYISQVQQKEMDLSAYKSYNYTDDQIESAVRNNEAAIAEIYYSTLRTISDAIQGLQTEIANYEVQLSSINLGQAAYPVTASLSGIVHMDTAYKTGMVVQAGAAIGVIVNENDNYYASVYTAANDMPLIHVGDSVDVAISGLTQSIYGTVGGTVSYIASEATADNENGTSSFLVNIDLDSVHLVSTQGNKVNLSNGMAVEARIQYDEVTYFKYALEALGLLTR